MISKQSASLRLKHFCANLMIKMLLYTVGATMVLILTVSTIPPLCIYLLIGDRSIDNQIGKEYKNALNHSNEQRTVNN